MMPRPLATFLAVATMASCSAEEPPNRSMPSEQFPTIGSIERLDPRVDAVIPPDAVLEVLAEGHEWTEGPVWVPALQAVLYSDVPNNAVYRQRRLSLRQRSVCSKSHCRLTGL